jgi:hypothetical protein
MHKVTIDTDQMDYAVVSAVNAVGGNLRAAIKQLILTNLRLEAELREMTAHVSLGFLRRGTNGQIG